MELECASGRHKGEMGMQLRMDKRVQECHGGSGMAQTHLGFEQAEEYVEALEQSTSPSRP